MNNENNKFQIDIDNLFNQNANDLSAIKELYRKLKELEEKILQIKYIDSTLVKKFKKEYEKFKKIILDENVQVNLANEIETINLQLNTKTSKEEIKNVIENINSQLLNFECEKATKQEIDVERKRIDNIVKNEGTSVNDLELQDIRIGVDNRVYDSAGSSVRNQILNLEKDIIEIENCFTQGKASLNISFSNKGVNNDGVVVGENLTRACNETLLHVSKNKGVNVTILDPNIKMHLFTFSSQRIFEKVKFNLTGSYSLKPDKYYRFLILKDDNTNITIDECINNIEIKAYYFNPVYETHLTFENDYYVNYENGRTYPFSEMFVSDYILVYNYQIILLNNIGDVKNEDLSGVAFYDVNKNYISGIQRKNLNVMEIEIPENAVYTRFTALNSGCKAYLMHKKINAANMPPLPPKEENPTKYNGKEISVFNSILCIGDSLTEGVFNYSENGGGLGIRGQYSYPTQLAKITGCNITNWGISGATTQSWYENKISISKWQWYDCAIINLGANDIEKNGVTALSSKQYLQKIIDKLKEDNSNIKIFLATVVPAYYNKDSEWYSTINQTRYELSRTNENCYFVDLSKYSETGDEVYHYGHLTALGYRKEAEEIAAYISKIIAENIKEFKWVQHIGTSHLGE